MVVVAGWGWNHVYYFEIDHAPQAEEYFAIGQRIINTMLKDIGQSPQRWKMIPAVEWDPAIVAEVMKRDPVRVR